VSTRLKVMVCTYLEPEQVDHLDRLAKKEKRPKAEIIREAIDRYVGEAKRVRPRVEGAVTP
jgi:predicted DNA-binding protein